MPSCATRDAWGPSLRSAFLQQTSGLAITSSTSAWWSIKTMEEEERRERRRRQRQQVVNCCKQLAAFLFSHIGLAAMVVAYSIMGGFLFRAIEAPAEMREKRLQVEELIEWKAKKIGDILDAISEACTASGSTGRAPGQGLDEEALQSLNETLKSAFVSFQTKVRDAVKDNGWNGSDDADEKTLQWSLAGAILYAVTVITTIGYGHIAPKTLIGRMLTILYALIGIPLTFLYLSNIGNFLADCFRLFYKRICCDIICCQKCERKRKRERLKLRRRRELAAQRTILLSMHSQMLNPLPPATTTTTAADDVIEGDDDDVMVFKSRGGGDGEGELTKSGVSGRFRSGDENPGFVWDDFRFPVSTATDLSLSPATETFHSPPTSSSSRSKKPVQEHNNDDDDEDEDDDNDDDDDDEDDDDDATGSEASDETVRETAIVDDASDDVIRESEIVDDDDDDDVDRVSRMTASQHQQQQQQSNRNWRPQIAPSDDRARTPSFRSTEFHQLDRAKETEILRDSSFEGDRNNFRFSRLKKRSKLYRSDPFLHASHSLIHDNTAAQGLQMRTRGPMGAPTPAARVPVRSMTVKPRRYANKNPEFRRQGSSVPSGRSDSKRCSSGDRWRSRAAAAAAAAAKGDQKVQSPGSKEVVAQEKAKENWKKLIEYTKQLAERERLEQSSSGRKRESVKRKGEAKRDRTPEVRKPNFDSERSPRVRKEVTSGDRRRGQGEAHYWAGRFGEFDSRSATLPSARLRDKEPPFHQSEESFVTAASEGRSSEGDSEDGGRVQIRSPPFRLKPRSVSLNSVAIDLSPPIDEFADFPEFIQDQPISFLDDPFDYEEEEEQEGKVTVPISICLIIISGYLFAGSALFAVWEDWDLVAGSYFCFVTLSTIGFGDIVPGTDMKDWESEAKLALCALWLAFGLSLLAMCFNLMQEEVKDKCKWIGQKLGLLKDEGQN